MCVAAAAIPAATLAVSAVGVASSIGLGIMSAQQQAAQAQASMNMQAQQAERQQQMQRQQMMQNQQHQRQQLVQNQRQQQENYNLQVAQSNAQILNNYRQQQQQVLNDRAGIMSRHEADKLTYQRSVERFDTQQRFNNEAANRSYVAEQDKMNEARKKAAFEQQAILAKSIGAKGSILAAGRTGQSVGLLVNDVERQAGFAMAQESAMLESKKQAAGIGMEGAFLQAQSANNQALSQVGFNPSDPYLPSMPDTPEFVDGNTFAIA